MAQVTITINSREYAVACDDGQERYMLQLARILDEKARQLTAGGAQINENMLLAMVGLLVADDLTEARKAATSVSENLSAPMVTHEPSMSDFAATDTELAESLKKVTEQIKMLANQIENL